MVPPTGFSAEKALRIQLMVPLELLREFDPTHAPWSPSDTAGSIMIKADRTMTMIADQII